MWFDLLLSGILALCHLAGVFFALQAILISRTPQAAIGWSLGLVLFPYVAIPLFAVFGGSTFRGYKLAGHTDDPALADVLAKARAALAPHESDLTEKYRDSAYLSERLTHLPVTTGNEATLLVDGDETFAAVGQAIDEAREYLIIQFFIVHDDELGRDIQRRLLAARERGVTIWMLIDQVGSRRLPAAYRRTLTDAGVELRVFVTNRERGKRFRLNFRNHRKLVIADGRVALLGGLNIGDEYMGRDPKFGPWRDTFVALEGPIVLALQLPFVEDWYFTTREIPVVRWEVVSTPGRMAASIVPGTPAAVWNTCPAAYFEVIRSARKRLWLASPYFVPDPALRAAIAHAALRGVDVRLILPQHADHILPWLSSFTFYPSMREAGVKIYRYQPGFMHQKVLLADDDLSIVGSTNLDYRSFILNFELSVAVASRAFAHRVEAMLEADFARAKPDDLFALENRGLLFRLKCRSAALLSPTQ
ncbi:MAG TPA: cardiolipin synthase [Chthoniobacterales bacterium]